MTHTLDLKTYCPRCSVDYIVNLPLNCTMNGFEAVLLQDGWGIGTDSPMLMCQVCVAKLRGGGGGCRDTQGSPTVSG